MLGAKAPYVYVWLSFDWGLGICFESPRFYVTLRGASMCYLATKRHIHFRAHTHTHTMFFYSDIRLCSSIPTRHTQIHIHTTHTHNLHEPDPNAKLARTLNNT